MCCISKEGKLIEEEREKMSRREMQGVFRRTTESTGRKRIDD